MRDKMDVLGELVLQEMAAGPAVGFDFGALVNPAAGATKAAIDLDKANKAEKQAKSDSDAAVAKSINADAQWANAEANLELAAKDPTAAARLRVERDRLQAEAQAAGSALGAEGTQKRAKKANDALVAAMGAASSAPKDIAKQAKWHAWQKVVSAIEPYAKTAADAAAGKSADAAIVPSSDGGNWLTIKRAGMPTYAWGLVGVGSLGALFLIIHAFRKK